MPQVKYPFSPLSSLWIPSRLVSAIVSCTKSLFFHIGEAQTASINDQNVYLDAKVKNVGSIISTFEHCTNFPHMEKSEHTLVMSETPTVVGLLSGSHNPLMMNEYLIPNTPFSSHKQRK